MLQKIIHWEVTSSDFFYEDVTCMARLYRKLKHSFGETISFLPGLGYIHLLWIIRWGPPYSFPSVNFSNRAFSITINCIFVVLGIVSMQVLLEHLLNGGNAGN